MQHPHRSEEESLRRQLVEFQEQNESLKRQVSAAEAKRPWRWRWLFFFLFVGVPGAVLGGCYVGMSDWARCWAGTDTTCH